MKTNSAILLGYSLWLMAYTAPALTDGPNVYTNPDAPQPLPPLPTPAQYKWHEQEIQMFIHFGPNTFTGKGWGSGKESPDIFNPSALDCEQWARVAKENGFTRITMTAKHHDGFCLWPSAFTEHSVKNSKWREGKGDVVGEFVKACRKYGLGVGIYLSPWDRHDPRFGTTNYNDRYINQVNEIFDRYGRIDSFWLDLAGLQDHPMPFDWSRIYEAIYRRNPACTIEMGGPDCGGLGNEAGSGFETCWNFAEVPQLTPSGRLKGDLPVAYTGGIQPPAERVGEHPNYKAIPTLRYSPHQGDASVRFGWFWNPGKSRDTNWWMQTYFHSIGRGSSMLFGFAPDRRGLIPDEDIAGAAALKQMLDATFKKDLAQGQPVTASTTWHACKGYDAAKAVDGDPYTYWSADAADMSGRLEVDLKKDATFNLVALQEPVFMGQRVKKYRVDYWDGSNWLPFSTGTTIGYKRLDRRPTVSARKVRLVIEDARSYPLISHFAVYLTPFTAPDVDPKRTGTKEEKAN